MKKNYWYILLILLFTGAVSFVVIYKTKDAGKKKAYILLPRKSGNSPEWEAAKTSTDKLLVKVRTNPSDTRSELALANAYIMESRASGNIAYYDKAAMQTIDNILAREPQNFDALLLRSLLQLSQHHFSEGLATATTAMQTDPNSAFVYGLLVDANVELGNYDAALDAADKMVTIRPDLRSYSRIAYLREIFGDYPGAAEAMQRAVTAGVAGEESTEWCRTQLGRIYENMGDRQNASFQYNMSLATRPAYPYALTGLARLALNEKKYDSAVWYYSQAAAVTNDLGIKGSLAEAYSCAGQVQKAKAVNSDVITEMNLATKANTEDRTNGHYSDKELAYAYLQNNDYDKALKHALAEYNRRPKNIEVNEMMAWVYYKRKETAKALPYLETALQTHSRKPELLCTAGLIYLSAGDTVKASKFLKLGLKQAPVMQTAMKEESTAALQKII